MEPTQTTTATTPEAGNGQKFKFFTGTTKAFVRKAADGTTDEHIIEGIASSNVRDRYGDTMSAQCQASMLKQAKGLTMFVNHSYNIPDDVAGKCVSAQLQTTGDIIDLAIEMKIAESNPVAMKSWELINKDQTTLAFSIGGIITDAEIDEENDNGDSWFPPLIINDLELLEISLVGIPANPRSYTRHFIEDIKKSAFKGAQRDPGVQKAFLKALGVKSVDEEFADLRDAEVVNAETAVGETLTETVVDAPATTETASENTLSVEVDATKAIGALQAADELVEGAKRAVADLEVQRDAISTEITTKASERDALVTEIAALEDKAAKLKATPTGRQTQASTDGSSNAAVPYSEMTQEQLDAAARKLGQSAAGAVIDNADVR